MKGQLAVKNHWNEVFISMVYKIATVVAVGIWLVLSIAADGGGSLLFFKALEEVRGYSPGFQEVMMRIVAVVAWTATGIPFFVAVKIGKLSVQQGYLSFGIGSVLINTGISVFLLNQEAKDFSMLQLGVVAALVTILISSFLRKESNELPKLSKEITLYVLCAVVGLLSILFNFLPGLIVSFSLVDVAAMPLQLRAEEKVRKEGVGGFVGWFAEWILLPTLVYIPTSFVFGSILLASDGQVLSTAITYANVGTCVLSVFVGLWLYNDGSVLSILKTLVISRKATLVLSVLVVITATLSIWWTSQAF